MSRDFLGFVCYDLTDLVIPSNINMVRKSIDFAQTLLKFQAGGGELTHGGAPGSRDTSRLSLGNQNVDSTDKKHNGHKVASAQYTQGSNNAPKDASLFALQTKNNSLARSNSSMLIRISEMESRISVLVNENIQLKKTSSKMLLNEALDGIEEKVMDKISGIFTYLKSVRAENGLGRNVQLEAFEIMDRPASTPIEEYFHSPLHNVKLPEISDKIGRQTKPYNVSDRISNNMSDRISYNVSNRIPSRVPDRSPLDKMSEESSDIVAEKVRSRVKDTVRPDKMPSSLSSEMELEEIQLNCLQDKSFSNSSCSTQLSKAPYLNKTILPESFSTFHLPSEQKCATIIEESEISVEKEERPRRNRKTVDYTPLPLGGKMRRESAKFLDAVGENVLINYVVKKERKVLGEMDMNKQRSHERKSHQRKSDQRKSNQRRSAQQGKRLEQKSVENVQRDAGKVFSNNDDLSVFDFQDTKKRRLS